MQKTFMGVRLRALREERGLSAGRAGAALGLSPSYLNQIEQNQRPLTVPVLLKISRRSASTCSSSPRTRRRG